MRDIPHSRYQAILATDSFDELRGCVQAVVQRLGFDGFLYLTTLPQSHSSDSADTFILSSYDPVFVKHYQDHRCHRFDPAAIHIRQHQYPTPWGRHSFTGTRAEPMYRVASRFGVCSGATFPVTPPSIAIAGFGYACGKSFEQSKADILASMPHGQLLATFVHQAVTRLLNLCEAPDAHRVTERERACLNLAAQGLRDGEIADTLSISPRTVLFHLGNARRKLKADNRAQMIARAMALKVIGL